MGFPQSHLQLQWWECSDDPSGGELFSMESYQDLAEERHAAQIEFEEAIKYQGLEHENAKKLAELTEKYKLARSYRIAIINELAKGAASGLHIDTIATSDSRNPYITLLSLKRWASESLNISILAELDTVKPVKPLPKMRQQEKVILDEIKKLGHDPQKLPKIIPGKPWVKSDVRQLVQYPPLFISVRVFDNTWERLLKSKEIIRLT
jgi:hypothetical protein